MENTDLQSAVEAVLKRLFIELEASGRHVHVTKEQAMALFGHPLTPKRPLSQPGQYLANERVTVMGPKGKFENVAVLGPEREAGQVEISLTDGRTLGITPPVRLSGNVANSPGAILRSDRGQVTLQEGVICAQRHIMNEQTITRRFAQAITRWRLRLNMNAKEFADFVGISENTVYNYESGRCMPQLYTAMLIAEKLGTSLDGLLHEE